MTPLPEVCADLKPLLPVLEDLVTQPDTQPMPGRTQPGSRPPWNTAVANILFIIHAGVRELEQDFRYQVTGTMTLRGGSDVNTIRAIDAVCRLAEALDQAYADMAARLFTRYVTAAMQLPAIDLEERCRIVIVPDGSERACPDCTRRMLRVFERSGRVACLGCEKRGQMMPGMVSDGYIEWEDGTIT
jgi:hypothetical protein